MKVLIFLLIPISVLSQKHINKEFVYQNKFCETLTNNGVNNLKEVRLIDNTRCDIVTEEHAIEVDFASKWGESIGQSLHYGLILHKKAGILLIIESEKDFKFLQRLLVTAKVYNITVWTINDKFKINQIKP